MKTLLHVCAIASLSLIFVGFYAVLQGSMDALQFMVLEIVSVILVVASLSEAETTV